MTEYQDNSEKYVSLREQYPVFVYDKFDLEKTDNEINISFHYSCNDKSFRTLINVPFGNGNVSALNDNLLHNIAFNMGLVELISYWKAFCSPLIKIKCGYLDDKQQSFFKKLWFKGLGEFFYLNNIHTTQEEFANIECESNLRFEKSSIQCEDAYIVPIGGGKDSVVSLELLRGKGKRITPMVINPRGATNDCIEVAGFKDDFIAVKRSLDPLIIQLNQEGYLNGHTPFSAMLAFTTLLCSAVFKKKYIALSNESSANEATDIKSGVNHQYSKSLEFENDFRAYYKEFITSDIEYFSLLRPIKELFIAKIFALLPYRKAFKSCNVGSKEDKWCLHCPKCLFAYIILAPFLTRNQLMSVFGNDLFKDESLSEYFKQLTGLCEVKPFECVGTIDEVNVALSMCVGKHWVNPESPLIKEWVSSPLFAKYMGINHNKFIHEQSEQHNLPEDLKDIFDNYYIYVKKAELIRKYKNANIAVMGLGREGQSTLRLFNELLPNKSLFVYDQNPDKLQECADMLSKHTVIRDKESLKLMPASTILFMSPGMAVKDYPEFHFDRFTNQCSVFLELFGRKCIGISGTKGKSTTSALLYGILKESLHNVILAGNMGIPFFDVMDRIKHNTAIVLELSCHQLQLIKRAPHISVLLNLYEEHLDHYNSFEEYCNAKLNLLRKSKKGDFFIYNGDDELIAKAVENHHRSVKTEPFYLQDYTFRDVRFLKGDHNKLNILAALKCAKILGVHQLRALRCADGFQGLPHRLELLGVQDGVKYYDDSISTIPQATLAALKALGDVSVLILGGMDRGIDYHEITSVITDFHVRNIAFVGLAGRRMYQIMKDAGLIKEHDYGFTSEEHRMHTIITDNWYEVVKFCKQYAVKDSSVLLSPAASSYDQFRNFEHRGDYFKSLIFQKTDGRQ